MYFNMKIYILIDYKILYVYIFFSKFYKTLKSKNWKFEKRKTKPE
jgi:hypothetical protein